MKGGDRVGLFKNLFTNSKATSNDDPFVDALVSLSSDDPNVFVSASTLQNSDIFAAISIIAGDLASNPIKSDSTLYNKMLNDHPNDVMNGYSFKFALATEMLLNGNSYAEINVSNHTLNFIPNNQMTVQQDDATQEVRYIYCPDGRTKRVIAPSNILHFKYFTRNGLIGISPLYALKDETNIQKAGNKLMAGFFNNGIHGTTLVKVDQAELDPQGREKIRRQFDEATTGDRALNTVVTDASLDVKSLPLNTDVLKLVNSNDWSTRQIAKAFGLSPDRLGVESEHSNQEQSNLQYLQGTLQHYEECFISELNYKLNQSFTYDNSKLLSLNPADQQQMAVDGYVNGLYTRNEARKLLNLDPVSGGDEFVSTKGEDTANGKAIDA